MRATTNRGGNATPLPARRRGLLTTLGVLTLLLLAMPMAAAPPKGGGGKGGGGNGGNGGGGGGGGGARPELHFQWRVPLDGSYSNVRPTVGPDGTIYAVDVVDNLYAVGPDGTVKWTVGDAGSKGVDVGPDGTIYTGNEDWIKAFRPDGSLKWTFVQQPRAFVTIDVAVGPDDNIYVVSSSGMGVFSLADTPTGPVLRWQNPEAYSRLFVGYTELEFGPTQDGADQQLYFYANGHTRAVRLSDGASVFTTGGGNTPPRVSPFDGTWHRPAGAFDPDGSLAWSFEYPLATGTREPTLASDGTHYAVNSGYILYAIDPDGFEEWRAEQDEFVGLASVDAAESIILLDTSGTTTHPAALLAVSATNGSSLWRMEFPGDGSGLKQFVDSSATFSASGDTAYLMTATAGSGARGYLNAVATDPTIPSASTRLRSVSIDIDPKSRRNGVQFTGNVTIQDENRGAVSGAVVSATWTFPDGSTVDQVATTGGTGVARFTLTAPGGLYYLTVTDIAAEGYTFDPAHSILTAGQAWF